MSSCLLPTRAVATIADPNFVKIFLSFRTREMVDAWVDGIGTNAATRCCRT